MIKVKLLTSSSKLPTRNTPTDAGLDLFSDETSLIKSRAWKGISTGISISLPESYYGRVAPRSGLAFKSGIDVFAGVIDSGYRGEIKVILYNASEKDYLINQGDKIAQLIIEKCCLWDPILADDLDESIRADRGFGSSGK